MEKRSNPCFRFRSQLEMHFQRDSSVSARKGDISVCYLLKSEVKSCLNVKRVCWSELRYNLVKTEKETL